MDTLPSYNIRVDALRKLCTIGVEKQPYGPNKRLGTNLLILLSCYINPAERVPITKDVYERLLDGNI